MLPDAPAPCPAPFGWPRLAPHAVGLMGVLNLTPNSFSDGGRYFDVEEALRRAEAIAAEGADILDIGGESTNPNAAAIPAEDEIARIRPVFEALRGRMSIPISIDTYKAATAEVALSLGATIVNDVWGLQRDPDLARVVADHGAGLCIMHNRPWGDEAPDVIADIDDFFARSLDIAANAGIEPAAIVLDPGIGFGKSADQNLTVLHHLDHFTRFGRPLLVGCSRKRFIGTVTGRAEPMDRMAGSLSSHVVAALNGATWVRAHDIAAHRDALLMIAAIRRESASLPKA